MTIYCVDTSAWHRSTVEAVAARWSELLTADRLALCEQVRLEILWSARSADDYIGLSIELDGMRQIEPSSTTLTRAIETQYELSRVGGLHHRSVKIADLLIAASAEIHGSTVLHYDTDFDRVSAITGQPTEWVVPRGSI